MTNETAPVCNCNEERFQYCVGIILQHEGRLSEDKRDPGQITNWGISLRFRS